MYFSLNTLLKREKMNKNKVQNGGVVRGRRAWVTPEMKSLLVRLRKAHVKDVTVSMEILDETYWMPTEIKVAFLPSQDRTGELDENEVGNETQIYKRLLYVKIITEMSDEELNGKLSLLNALTTIAGPRTTLTPWTSSKEAEMISVKMGAYKRPGFDAAYQAMLALDPSLTSYNFARSGLGVDAAGWNLKLVDIRQWTNNANCVHTWDAAVPTGAMVNIVTLSILNEKIEENKQRIETILT